jgi:Flp pilus assembly protein TadD
MHLLADKKANAALTEARKAVDANASNAGARIVLATTLAEAGQPSEALEEAERATELAPLDGATHFELGLLLGRQNKLERGVEEARLAVTAAPENTRAHSLLLASLLDTNEDAVDAGREALAVSPFDAEIHRLLGAALMRKDDPVAAFHQLSYSVLLDPNLKEPRSDLHRALLSLVNSLEAPKLLHQAVVWIPESTAALSELAWVFATHPRDELRDGPEAVRLANHACALTKRSDPMLLAILAAAYAETNDFGEAISTIQESLSKARSSKNTDAAAFAQNLLVSFQSHKPVRAYPSLR